MGEMQKCGGLEHEENGVPPVPGAEDGARPVQKKKNSKSVGGRRRYLAIV
jgi:hypothetical protein